MIIGSDFFISDYADESMPVSPVPRRSCLRQQVPTNSSSSSATEPSVNSEEEVRIKAFCEGLLEKIEVSCTDLSCLAKKDGFNPPLSRERAVERLMNMYRAGNLEMGALSTDVVATRVKFAETAIHFSCDRDEVIENIDPTKQQNTCEIKPDRNQGIPMRPLSGPPLTFEMLIDYMIENYTITETHVLDAFTHQLNMQKEGNGPPLEMREFFSFVGCFDDALCETLETMMKNEVDSPLETLIQIFLKKVESHSSDEVTSPDSGPEVKYYSARLTAIFSDEDVVCVLEEFFTQQILNMMKEGG